MSKIVTYTPPGIDVLAPGDGNRVLVCLWPASNPPEQVLVVMAEEAAKAIGEKLIAPSLITAKTLPLLIGL